MITSWDAQQLLDPMFKKWEEGIHDKWDVYPKVFNLLDEGHDRADKMWGALDEPVLSSF